jgi:hypothetical protein
MPVLSGAGIGAPWDADEAQVTRAPAPLEAVIRWCDVLVGREPEGALAVAIGDPQVAARDVDGLLAVAR